jgi:carotenoid cleavage dioxygenase-like enzyme
VEGELPPDLLGGTLLLGGPGLISAYGHHVRSGDDADGLVSSLAFGDTGSLFFRCVE